MKVIFDAAYAFGVTADGINTSSFGDTSIFSFHATKVYNTIEGGAVTFKEPSLRKKLKYLKNHSITGHDTVEDVGCNAKMNEFQASLGLCNLRYVDKKIIKRAKVVERYNERLTGTKGITLSLPQKGVKSNYAYYPVVFTGYRHNRDGIYEKLKADDIYSRKHFYPLTSDYQCYKGRFDSSRTPVAQYITSRMLRLPLYADFALSDVDRICDLILGRR